MLCILFCWADVSTMCFATASSKEVSSSLWVVSLLAVGAVSSSIGRHDQRVMTEQAWYTNPLSQSPSAVTRSFEGGKQNFSWYDLVDKFSSLITHDDWGATMNNNKVNLPAQFFGLERKSFCPLGVVVSTCNYAHGVSLLVGQYTCLTGTGSFFKIEIGSLASLDIVTDHSIPVVPACISLCFFIQLSV